MSQENVEVVRLSTEPHNGEEHIVAGRLGDDPTTLLGVYAHLLPRSDEQAAQVLAGVLADKALTNSVS